MKPLAVKRESVKEESSSCGAKKEETVNEEKEEEKYEPDLDLEADFPQGKHRPDSRAGAASTY